MKLCVNRYIWKMSINARVFFLSIYIFFFLNLSHAQITTQQKARKIIEELCDSTWQGRPTSKHSSDLFQKFLKKYVSHLNVSTQVFKYTKDSTVIEGKNFLLHSGLLKKSKVLIVAHYDHLGSGGRKSKELNRQCVHPGADDNASGVAAALLLTDILCKNHNSKNFAVAFTSGHEDGLYGSKHLASQAIRVKWPVSLVINLDMVGRLDTTSRKLRVETNAPIKEYNTPELQTTMQQVSSLGEHTAFLNQKISVAFVTTGLHDDYHRCTDTPEKINYEGIETIVNYLSRTICDALIVLDKHLIFK